MDRNGIDAAVTSISVPGTHFGDDAKARDLARRCNEYSAEMISRRPRRFGAFAAMPLPDVAGACTEIRHALEVLKLDGVGLFTSYAGKHLGDPAFDPVMEILNTTRRSLLSTRPIIHRVRPCIWAYPVF